MQILYWHLTRPTLSSRSSPPLLERVPTTTTTNNLSSNILFSQSQQSSQQQQPQLSNNNNNNFSPGGQNNIRRETSTSTDFNFNSPKQDEKVEGNETIIIKEEADITSINLKKEKEEQEQESTEVIHEADEMASNNFINIVDVVPSDFDDFDEIMNSLPIQTTNSINNNNNNNIGTIQISNIGTNTTTANNNNTATSLDTVHFDGTELDGVSLEDVQTFFLINNNNLHQTTTTDGLINTNNNNMNNIHILNGGIHSQLNNTNNNYHHHNNIITTSTSTTTNNNNNNIIPSNTNNSNNSRHTYNNTIMDMEVDYQSSIRDPIVIYGQGSQDPGGGGENNNNNNDHRQSGNGKKNSRKRKIPRADETEFNEDDASSSCSSSSSSSSSSSDYSSSTVSETSSSRRHLQQQHVNRPNQSQSQVNNNGVSGEFVEDPNSISYQLRLREAKLGLCTNRPVLSDGSQPILIVNLYEEKTGYSYCVYVPGQGILPASHLIPYCERYLLDCLDNQIFPSKLVAKYEEKDGVQLSKNGNQVITEVRDYRRFARDSSTEVNDTQFSNSPVIKQVILTQTTQSVLSDVDLIIKKSMSDHLGWTRKKTLNIDNKNTNITNPANNRDRKKGIAATNQNNKNTSSSKSKSKVFNSNSRVNHNNNYSTSNGSSSNGGKNENNLSRDSNEANRDMTKDFLPPLTYNQRMEIEKKVVNATAGPLCLDPNPIVGYITNRTQFAKYRWNTKEIKSRSKVWNNTSCPTKEELEYEDNIEEIEEEDFEDEEQELDCENDENIASTLPTTTNSKSRNNNNNNNNNNSSSSNANDVVTIKSEDGSTSSASVLSKINNNNNNNGVSSRKKSKTSAFANSLQKGRTNFLPFFDFVMDGRSKLKKALEKGEKQEDLFKLPPVFSYREPNAETQINREDIAKLCEPPQPAILRGIPIENSVKKIEEYVLETERRKRPHTTKLSIYQRNNVECYFGELEMESFADPVTINIPKITPGGTNASQQTHPQNITVNMNPLPSTKCQFELGCSAAVTLYVQQFSDIFTEDGRRPCKITYQKVGQPPRIICTPSYKTSSLNNPANNVVSAATASSLIKSSLAAAAAANSNSNNNSNNSSTITANTNSTSNIQTNQQPILSNSTSNAPANNNNNTSGSTTPVQNAFPSPKIQIQPAPIAIKNTVQRQQQQQNQIQSRVQAQNPNQQQQIGHVLKSGTTTLVVSSPNQQQQQQTIEVTTINTNNINAITTTAANSTVTNSTVNVSPSPTTTPIVGRSIQIVHPQPRAQPIQKINQVTSQQQQQQQQQIVVSASNSATITAPQVQIQQAHPQQISQIYTVSTGTQNSISSIQGGQQPIPITIQPGPGQGQSTAANVNFNLNLVNSVVGISPQQVLTRPHVFNLSGQQATQQGTQQQMNQQPRFTIQPQQIQQRNNLRQPTMLTLLGIPGNNGNKPITVAIQPQQQQNLTMTSPSILTTSGIGVGSNSQTIAIDQNVLTQQGQITNNQGQTIGNILTPQQAQSLSLNLNTISLDGQIIAVSSSPHGTYHVSHPTTNVTQMGINQMTTVNSVPLNFLRLANNNQQPIQIQRQMGNLIVNPSGIIISSGNNTSNTVTSNQVNVNTLTSHTSNQTAGTIISGTGNLNTQGNTIMNAQNTSNSTSNNIASLNNSATNVVVGKQESLNDMNQQQKVDGLNLNVNLSLNVNLQNHQNNNSNNSANSSSDTKLVTVKSEVLDDSSSTFHSYTNNNANNNNNNTSAGGKDVKTILSSSSNTNKVNIVTSVANQSNMGQIHILQQQQQHKTFVSPNNANKRNLTIQSSPSSTSSASSASQIITLNHNDILASPPIAVVSSSTTQQSPNRGRLLSPGSSSSPGTIGSSTPRLSALLAGSPCLSPSADTIVTTMGDGISIVDSTNSYGTLLDRLMSNNQTYRTSSAPALSPSSTLPALANTITGRTTTTTAQYRQIAPNPNPRVQQAPRTIQSIRINTVPNVSATSSVSQKNLNNITGNN